MPLEIQHPRNEQELNHLFDVVDSLYRKKYHTYQECDDIIQQLLIQANKAVETYKGNKAKFKTYLFFLLQNKERNMHVKMYDNQAMFRKSMTHFSHVYWQNESEDDTM